MSAAHRIYAPAKINLFLHVGERGPDGYHALQSLVVFADTGDWVEATPGPGTITLHVAGPHGNSVGPGADNLVLKAAALLRDSLPTHKRNGTGAALRLEKHLPVASGIGGGSSDAAATLLLLNHMWGLARTPQGLDPIALQLGSDVPVCLRRRPQWMSGRGERLMAGPALPPFWFVLVNPGVAVATGAVFAALHSRCGSEPVSAPHTFPDASALAVWLASVSNDLEAPARTIAAEIGSVLGAIAKTPGCLLARMSGSGATCFGLFAGVEAARAAAAILAKQYPDGWVQFAAHYDDSDNSFKMPG